jgi:CHASE3 domain sensor protein/putative methionine-R-sulfoxide reductase with GAF domain
MRRIYLFLKGNVVYASIFLIIALIVLTVFFAIRNQRIMRQTNVRIEEANVIIKNVSDLWVGINLMDLGVRGYALTKTDGLLSPFDQALRLNPTYLDTIRLFMDKQDLPTTKLDEYIVLNDEYIALCQQMIALVRLDSLNDFVSLLEEDRGLALWQAYSAFSTDLVNLQNEIKSEAEVSYQSAVNGNIMLQIVLFLIGVPSLYLIYYKIKKHEDNIRALQLNLEHNNRKYVFDPGTPIKEDLESTMSASIENLKKASGFIDKITRGESDASWPGMTPDNVALNRVNLSGTLINMRDQMNQIKEEDRARIWATEGLTKFTEIIRQYQQDVNGLCEHAIRFIARYMDAQQGGVFLLQELDDEQYLELVACYAFDKKKFIEKRVNIGEGLIGQAFMERSTVVLKEVPKGYTHITSGLGEATPNHVMIVPMQYNEITEGVLEIAGFQEWKDHQRNFMDKATEYMAAALSSVRSTQKMKEVMEQMKAQTEQLHSQEEEMRQNMEELAATNEVMKRKEAEYLKQIGATG